MNKNGKKSLSLKGKGFYAALGLVIAGGALASFLAINNMMGSLSTNDNKKAEEQQWGLEDTQVEKKKEDIPEVQSKSSQPSKLPQSSSVSPKPQQKPVESVPSPEPPIAQYALPMSSKATAPFSADELVYSATMGDWRTHNGMDMGGATNDGVHAPMSGTVQRVYEDALWGNVVEIVDGDISVSLMGLGTKNLIANGAQVKTGDTIGLLGDIPAEGADGVHLHIEMKKAGALVNPSEYLK